MTGKITHSHVKTISTGTEKLHQFSSSNYASDKIIAFFNSKTIYLLKVALQLQRLSWEPVLNYYTGF